MPEKPRRATAPLDELIDSARLAALLSSTPGSIRKAHQAGLIPRGTTIPGLGLRWRMSQIQAWIKQKVPAT